MNVQGMKGERLNLETPVCCVPCKTGFHQKHHSIKTNELSDRL